MKQLVLFLGFLLSATLVTAQGWQDVGGAEHGTASITNSYYNDIAFDPAGTPYIILNDAFQGYKATVRKFNGTNWEDVGIPGFSPYYVDYTSIAIGGNGVIYAGYLDYNAASKASVKKFDGSNWVNVGPQGFSTGTVSKLSLAVDKTNIPYITYVDAGVSNRVIVRKFNGSNWTNVGGTSFTTNNSTSPAIAFDTAGTLYLAYRDGTSGKASVKKFNGTSWVSVAASVTISPSYADELSLTIHNMTPFVAYQDGNDGNKITVRKYDGSAWVDVGTPAFSPSTVYENGIAVDTGGTPYVVFRDYGISGRAMAMMFNGTDWDTLSRAFLSEGTAAYNAIAAGPDGIPYVIFSDYAYGGKTMVHKLDGNDWTIVGPVSLSRMSAQYGALSVDGNGVPYMVFQNAMNYKAVVKKFTNGVWDAVGPVEGFSDGYTYYSTIAINKANIPFVAYHDQPGSGKALVKKYHGSSWTDVGDPASFAGTSASYLSLAMDTSGLPYLSYRDDNNGQKIYAKRFDGVSWVTLGTSSVSAGAAYYTSMAVNSSNMPFIAYQEASTGKLNVKQFDGGSWVSVGGPDFTSSAADIVSLAIGKNDTVFVAYRDHSAAAGATVMKFDGANWITVGVENLSNGYCDYIHLKIDESGKPYITYNDYYNSNKATVRGFDGNNWTVLGTGAISMANATVTNIGIYNNTIYASYNNQGYWVQRFNDCSTPVLTVSSTATSPICPGVQVSYTASVSAGGINPVYQWFKNGLQVSSGANDSVFTDPTPTNGDSVYCVITNACGSDTASVTSVGVNDPAVVTADPVSIAVCAAAQASFSVTIAGNPAPAIVWQVSTNGGAIWTTLPGVTGTTFNYVPSFSENGNQYRVIASNGCASDTSGVAILTVHPFAVVTTHPVNDTICNAGTYSFTVASTSSVITAVQWQISYDGSTWYDMVDDTLATLSKTGYSVDNGAYYRAIVFNSCGPDTSSLARLTVHTAPSFYNYISSNTVTAGSSVSMWVEPVSGIAPFMYGWEVSTDGGNNWNLISGAVDSVYSFVAGFAQNGYYYRPVVSNSCGIVPGAAYQLTVNGGSPSVVGLSSTSLCQGGSVDITFAANGAYNAGNVFTAQLSNSVGVFAATPVVIGTLASTTGGTINANIGVAQGAGTGYRVRIVASDPSVVGANNGSDLTVTTRPTSTQAAISSSGTLTFCPGGSVTFSVPSTSGFSYQWFKDGIAISGETGTSYTASASGVYHADVINASGCSRSSALRTVTVKPLPGASISPISTQHICNGQSVTLQANTGSGLTYKWFLNGSQVSGTASSFTATAAGGYTVQVTLSGCAQMSDPVTVNVNPLPNVQIMHAGPLSFCTGGSVSLTASGANTYVWSNTATTTGIVVNTSGSFTVTGTDANGCSATSAPITTTVNAPPAATVTPATTQNICPGQTVTFNANTGAGLSYQWLNNGNPISGETGNSFTASAIGTYSVQVTNAANCSAVSSSVSVTSNNCVPIITSLSTNTLCQGGAINITFNANGSYAGGNVFTAQLSNSAGVFGATPTVIGTLSSTTGGTIAGTIGLSQGAGTAYRIRIVASSPAVTGTDNGMNLTVVARPTSTQAAISNSGSLTFCPGGSVAFSVPATAGFSYQWYKDGSAISGETTTGYTATVSGVYHAEVANSSGCSRASALRTVTIKPLPAATINPATTQNICSGQSVTLQANTGSGLSYKWFINGNQVSGTSSSYIATVAGSHTVQVTLSGCTATSDPVTINVNPLPPATLSPSTTQNICSGQTVTFQANTGAGLTYEWLKGGLPVVGQTNSSFTTGIAGAYSVKVTNSFNCSVVTQATEVVVVPCTATVTDTGTRKVCQNGTIVVNYSGSNFNAGNVFTLQLSEDGGSFTNAQDIGTLSAINSGTISGTIPSATPPGSGYKLRLISSNPATTGPASALTLEIQSALTDTVSLCAVTVDSATGKNLLVWNKPGSTDIDSFIIYRNTSVAGVYERIGAQAYNIFSTFLDTASDPFRQAQRYYITASNSCNETAPGSRHRTMHLTISKGQDAATWNLIWNGYEGFEHGSYGIWRGTSAAGMSLLSSVEANSFNSFTDQSAPAGSVYYMVTIADAPSCNPMAKTTAGFTIASNIATNATALPAANWMDVQLFPNPAAEPGQLVIQSSDPKIDFSIRVSDVSGRMLEEHSARAGIKTIIGVHFAPGIYLVDVSGNGLRMTRKWIKR